MPIAPKIVYITHPTIPAGGFISQDPPEDEVIDPNGGEITVYYSLGPGTVSFIRMIERRPYAVFSERV